MTTSLYVLQQRLSNLQYQINHLISGSSWSFYDASNNVNLNGYNIYNGNDISSNKVHCNNIYCSTGDFNNLISDNIYSGYGYYMDLSSNTFNGYTLNINDLISTNRLISNLISLYDISGNFCEISPTYNLIGDNVSNIRTTRNIISMNSSDPSLISQIVMTDSTTGYNNNIQFNQYTMNGLNSVYTAQSNAIFLQNGDNTRQIVNDLDGKQIYIADENGFGSYLKSTQNSMYDNSNNMITMTPTNISMTDVNSNILTSLTTNSLTIQNGTSGIFLDNNAGNIYIQDNELNASGIAPKYIQTYNLVLNLQDLPSTPVDGMLNWDGKLLQIYSGNESIWKSFVFL
jgi:hypothetical protein